MEGGSLSGAVSSLLRKEGVLAFWKGIQPAWGREAFYASIKIGGYGPIRDAMGAGDKNAPFLLKFAAGATSGSVGAAVGNPFDVLKTMMQANKGKGIPPTQLARDLLRNQGPTGFYRGLQANCTRAMVLNGTKMAVYDKTKGFVQEKTGLSRSDPRSVFMSSVVAGFFMTITVSPFDILRTKLMNQPVDKKIYNGFVDCAVKLVKEGGPLAFWRGFLPIWGRFAPMATLQLLIFEGLMSYSGYGVI